MQVLFQIPGPLREFTGNQSVVRVEVEAGANLLQVLQALFVAHPGLRVRVLTETGETRQHVNIFVANENVRYTGGLATAIPAGAEVSIVPAISGGCEHGLHTGLRAGYHWPVPSVRPIRLWQHQWQPMQSSAAELDKLC